MRIPLGVTLAFALIASAPAIAQPQEHHEEAKAAPAAHAVDRNPPRANGGKIPPAPEKRDVNAARDVHKFDDGRSSDRPHVANNHWYGHEAPNDPRFHLDHPFPHGKFAHFGPSYRYSITRIDVNAHRFWFPGGFYFDIAAFDWAQCADWCWNCGNDFVVYEDTDHVGWYLLYNVHTGVYVHCQYMGT